MRVLLGPQNLLDEHARRDPAHLQSPYGRIEGEWRRVADGIRYTLSVPTGVRGVVRLPGLGDLEIRSGGSFDLTVTEERAAAA
ncbi:MULTISPECIES: alpha-L-rhamnosidase C-terminal domain-containing protein [unclassified Microbacterium]|uniref:alpha-L-rhamnosidase C-terminal domain-containing protein n=1 Tax=unclassified Microbacterium TaxID=2609290 RepID=UPI001600C862|nr:MULTISPECIES: alpha-L-rhamnosidase C-terminal domain-containing protein [unclassified Microbacterium]MBT2485507.1 hypothetical protein [Microbacterium sp. ISL-108]